MSTMENTILKALVGSEVIKSDVLAQELGVDHQVVVGAIKSLEAGGYVTSEIEKRPTWKLTAEAIKICEEGSPEFQLWELLAAGEMPQDAVAGKLGRDVTAVALSNGMKTKTFVLRKEDGKVIINRSPSVSSFRDTTRLVLSDAARNQHIDPKDGDMLKKRKLATLEDIKVFSVRRGPSFAPEVRGKAAGDLTKEMLLDGSWRTTEFKAYNLAAAGREVSCGQLHPLLKVRQEFREIFMEMGFQEMETDHWVESSFWNFDSLFIPQNHPARDMQDTFFISKPATSELKQQDVVENVRKMHEKNFKYTWKESEARRNVLRTHTTSCSAFWLHHLARNSPLLPDGRRAFRPGRYYSIDRVFRNEEMDRTHLCEFHQIEGCVIDRNISLANMMHTFELFFRRIGVERLRFKPVFNPYTEPSMEIFGWHTQLKRWIEVGNSGLFRPEMLVPLGFDEDVTVMAWGLSLERPTMIKYGLSSIHELFGHKVDLRFIRNSKLMRF
ncbi:phenylalanyl-tRNA synthetase alpha chain, putative [Trypanosoma equiperdum]|uniref:phenylalanine--tRNA ligase n=2 Tax=Trypanozoon TaxID=39700 RepID=Q382C5_TRYB2|nr:phenylalanyl-tRNA synthetase alpha subunit [Trypanosoma brucei brucei TREU927]EAN80356.1 phenylalanyl-tRNA synthetase alpha chain, putative [Trypanosoma brucei brucei TREU927]SCU73078.1 phenylalanyl-tRNA synthetase alpha chain, putative [Trypanosoma equiperdum]